MNIVITIEEILVQLLLLEPTHHEVDLLLILLLVVVRHIFKVVEVFFVARVLDNVRLLLLVKVIEIAE